MRYIALICARGGSKGLPGKNIKLFNGAPLIGMSIDVAKQVNRIDRVLVSTDSKHIANVAIECGAEVPFMRPSYLAQDDTPEWLVWLHALEYINSTSESMVDGLVVLPTTAPLRESIDVERCLNEYEKDSTDVVITVSEAHRNPYFNMVKENKHGYSSLVCSIGKISRRQDAPIVYDMTTVAYIVNPKFLRNNSSLFDGRVRSVKIPIERSIDIDTEFDFRIAEILYLMKKDNEVD